MPDDKTTHKNPAADLTEPAGELAPPTPGLITNRTTRRREMLEHLADDPDDGRETPEEAAGPGGDNRQVYEAERAGRQQ